MFFKMPDDRACNKISNMKGFASTPRINECKASAAKWNFNKQRNSIHKNNLKASCGMQSYIFLNLNS